MLVELRLVPQDRQRSEDGSDEGSGIWSTSNSSEGSYRRGSRSSRPSKRSPSAGMATASWCWERELLRVFCNEFCCAGLPLAGGLSAFESPTSEEVRRSGGIHFGRTGSLAANFWLVVFSRERRLTLFSLRKFLDGVGPVGSKTKTNYQLVAKADWLFGKDSYAAPKRCPSAWEWGELKC